MHENGVIATDGSKRDFDVVIWATGYTGTQCKNFKMCVIAKARAVTMPFQDTKVYGRSGRELHDRWKSEGAPTAYAGMQYPDLPNFCERLTLFLEILPRLLTQEQDTMTGPNTLSGHFSLTMIM
jgi:hypothetical protein